MLHSPLEAVLFVAALAVLAFLALLLSMSQDRRGRRTLLGPYADPGQNLGKDHPYGALMLHVAVMLGAAYLAWRAVVSKRLFHDTEAADPAQFWFQWALLPLFEIVAARNLISRIRTLLSARARGCDSDRYRGL